MPPTKDTHTKLQMQQDNWDDGDVHLLLEIWADDRVQAELEDNGQNITAYRHIADRLNRMLAEGVEMGAGVTGRSEQTAESCCANIKSPQQATSPADIVNKENYVMAIISAAISLCWFAHVLHIVINFPLKMVWLFYV